MRALALPVEEISREHAAFVRRADGGGVVVRDLDSKNGVLVGGVHVAGERALVDGDQITVGPVTLSFEAAARYLRELAQHPDPAPAVTASPEPDPDPEPVPAPEPPPSASPPVATRAPRTTQLIGVIAAVTLLLLVAAAVALFWPRR